MTDTIDREAIKAHFIAERGYWRPWTEALLAHNPAFLQRYADYAGHPARTGPLSARMVELVYVALDSSATHLFPTGLQVHMTYALQAGATPAEIFDVLHLVTLQGVDSVYQSVEVLAEEAGWAAAGVGRVCPTRADADGVIERARLLVPGREQAIAWLHAVDPSYLAALLDFVEHGRPAAEGLTPSDRAIVETALHSCFSGQNPTALRSVIRHALSLGVTDRELLQAIQLGAHLSVHGAALGAGTYAGMASADDTHPA